MPVSPAHRFTALALSLLAACLPSASAAADPQPPKGQLVVVGGASKDPEISKRTLALAGGAGTAVVVLPQASQVPANGEATAAMWRDLGAGEVTLAVKLDAGDKEKIQAAGLIWMPGGDQKLLIAALDQAGVIPLIRERYQSGAVVGGSSAGAAVMSSLMMTGSADLKVVDPQGGLTAGLGLWPEVIVDQHFLQRQRFNRLLSAVLQHPEKIGVGIDENTAVIVSAEGWEVIGQSQVLILDARHATGLQAGKDSKAAVQDVVLHLLRPGMKWRP